MPCELFFAQCHADQDQHDDDDRKGDRAVALIADIVGERAADAGRQVLKDVVLGLFLRRGPVQKQDNQRPEDCDSHPIIDRLQDTSP